MPTYEVTAVWKIHLTRTIKAKSREQAQAMAEYELAYDFEFPLIAAEVCGWDTELAWTPDIESVMVDGVLIVVESGNLPSTP